MGCDIHSVVQKRVNGEWVTYREGFSDRNYHAFALLAGVRNNFDDIVPISEERGFPKGFVVKDDAHPLPRKFEWEEGSYRIPEKGEKRTYWMGDHSFGYCSARELAQVDLRKKLTRGGLVSKNEFLRWDRYDRKHGKSPESWCGGTSCEVITEEEFRARQERGELPKEVDPNYKGGFDFGGPYVDCKWTVALAEHLGADFITFMHTVIHDAVNHEGLDSVRFVFGFDN